MKSQIISAGLIALSIAILGFCIKTGIDNFVNKDNRVTVKGLAEVEVEADKVTWPIVFKEIGDNLPELYDRINKTQSLIKSFLLQNGITEEDITVNPPAVIDMSAQRYDSNVKYRYNITSCITVTSKNVKLVRSIISKQGALLKDGIAIEEGGYENPITYEFVSFADMKPKMMQEAIENAAKTAQQFAEHSHSKLNKIIRADQGQFSIEDRDVNTPFIKKVRVVTTITYSLKD
ncbi:MAG: SIMPL domain-containing protein [Phocaeicola sp.]|nr:SIMPL domain-containing protein [Phocaeicola sp.]